MGYPQLKMVDFTKIKTLEDLIKVFSVLGIYVRLDDAIIEPIKEFLTNVEVDE
jgi:hypothetical protein